MSIEHIGNDYVCWTCPKCGGHLFGSADTQDRHIEDHKKRCPRNSNPPARPYRDPHKMGVL